MNVVFLGAGNLATHLACALHQKGVTITQVFSRTTSAAQCLADRLGATFTNNLKAVCTTADVYIYALKDEVLAQVAAQINVPNALHLHTAGSMSLSVFGTDKPHCGVLYPMQTFSKSKAVDFATIPIFVETAQASDMHGVKMLASRISPHIYEANTEQRAQTHIAAVFACNFTNCMYAIAEKLLQETNLPFQTMLALIDETAAKVHEITPKQAQTGPAVRGDTNVMHKHLAMLTDEKQKKIYQLLSEYIQQNG